MTDDLSDTGVTTTTFVLFLLIGGLMFVDLLVDYREGVSASHVMVESVVLLLAVIGSLLVAWRLQQTRRSLARLGNDLTQAQVQAAHWQRQNERSLRGIGEAIQSQFSEWAFTDAEADVALLLIKGLSHREIANLRNTSERTVRHQAQSAYRKASLPGRTALSAFFLEDMLPGR
jgi:DNA-binding CsgD family transcriptional regulator